MQAYFADHFVLPLPVGHTFPMAKYERLRSRLVTECPGIALAEALPASDGELALVHTPRYVDAVAEGHLNATEQREIGFPWSLRMAGGYGRNIDDSVAVHLRTLQEAFASWCTLRTATITQPLSIT